MICIFKHVRAQKTDSAEVHEITEIEMVLDSIVFPPKNLTHFNLKRSRRKTLITSSREGKSSFFPPVTILDF